MRLNAKTSSTEPFPSDTLNRGPNRSVHMLTLATAGGQRDCGGMRRRDLLRIGSLALGGLSLPGLLAARARAADAGLSAAVKDKAVVLLFLAGGPSHIETFDPRMDAPEGVRSVSGELATTIPGVT